MMLILLIMLLFVGGLLVWLADRARLADARWLTLILLGCGLGLLLFGYANAGSVEVVGRQWYLGYHIPWIQRFGINLTLAVDGLGFVMVLLTLFLGLVAVLSSWREIEHSRGFFHFNLLWTLAGVVGVFTALDLFLFFVFWEVMLVPMYFIIAIWGHENRTYAALKFFIFTQASGLLMLLAIVGLVYYQYQASGILTFNYFVLLDTPLTAQVGYWLMLGFFIAFAVKLPAVLVHSWLPDAHTQAPTAGSVILAGVLLKTGAYGIIRFVVPLFPEASAQFASLAMALGVGSIIYGAALAFAQTDLKRLIAYTSISHMGFVLLGVYAGNEEGLQGAVMTMLAHGMTSAALFAFAGAIQQRIHTRDMRQMGGFWTRAPRLGAWVLFFSVAALGMPGLANFVGEFLVLIGAFKANAWITVAACAGLILAPVYSLLVIQKVFHGEPQPERQLTDAGTREVVMLGMMAVITVVLGLFPHLILDLVSGGLSLLPPDAPVSGDLSVGLGLLQEPIN
ncbi:MAG: NADH-quinone oxidoreductase subunit M [Pseudomonadales bacterium]